jgi:3-oxoacyl-[acyl-carrier protein] reductase
MKLEGKVAIITGAGQGIGREMATDFAAEGARVVVADIKAEAAARAATELQSAGFEAIGVTVDVTDPAQVDAMVGQAMAAFGQIDVLVNNAGIGLNVPFLETELADWERVLKANLTGTFLCGQAVARVMVNQGDGRIVNVGSISGQRGAQGRAAYGASKAGVIQLTRVMALELAPKGVRVNAISPGPVDTEQSRTTHTEATRRAYLDRLPVGRYGARREIAAAALFLASEESGFVVGHILNVDGGFDSAGLRFDPEG